MGPAPLPSAVFAGPLGSWNGVCWSRPTESSGPAVNPGLLSPPHPRSVHRIHTLGWDSAALLGSFLQHFTAAADVNLSLPWHSLGPFPLIPSLGRREKSPTPPHCSPSEVIVVQTRSLLTSQASSSGLCCCPTSPEAVQHPPLLPEDVTHIPAVGVGPWAPGSPWERCLCVQSRSQRCRSPDEAWAVASAWVESTPLTSPSSSIESESSPASVGAAFCSPRPTVWLPPCGVGRGGRVQLGLGCVSAHSPPICPVWHCCSEPRGCPCLLLAILPALLHPCSPHTLPFSSQIFQIISLAPNKPKCALATRGCGNGAVVSGHGGDGLGLDVGPERSFSPEWFCDSVPALSLPQDRPPLIPLCTSTQR